MSNFSEVIHWNAPEEKQENLVRKYKLVVQNNAPQDNCYGETVDHDNCNAA